MEPIAFNAGKKRLRDDNEADLETIELPKRSCLPFRSSPTTQHNRLFSQSPRSRPKPLFTQTLTPADSEEEMSPPFSSTTDPRPRLSSSLMNTTTVLDIHPQSNLDTNMVDQDTAMLSPKASPCTVLPPQIGSMGIHDTSSGGRLPTPIYGHFQHSLDLKMDMGGDSESPQVQTQKEVDWEVSMRRRRLPTPISEDEPMNFAGPVVDGPDPGDLCPDSHLLRRPARYPPPLPNQSPKAGKIVFSMGMRADCEMCRNKVPGHSNHIFRI